MSEAVNSQFVAQALAFLRAGYPSFKPAESDWRTTLRVYFEALKHYPREIWPRVTARAHTAHPQWFPTLGQLKEVFEAEHRGWLVRQQKPAAVAGLLAEPSRLPPDNPWEQFARECEAGKGSNEARQAAFDKLLRSSGLAEGKP